MLSVQLCVQHDGHDAVHHVGPSVAAETCETQQCFTIAKLNDFEKLI